MNKYTFNEWVNSRQMLSEGVNSEPQPGDFVITNPKAFMDSVIGKRGGLKNDGRANLASFSRFRVNDVNGRKVSGAVHHRTYSGGHTKNFNSYDFLDVSPAFGLPNGKVWLNNAPGRRATAHYINKMYPVWAGKMGMDGYATPEQQAMVQQNNMMQQQAMAQHAAAQQATAAQEMPQPQMQPQQPQMQPQQQFQMQNRNVFQQRPQQPQQRPVAPQYKTHSDHGAGAPRSSGTRGFGFESPSQAGGGMPGGAPGFSGDTGSVGTDSPGADMGGGENMALAASYNPIISGWKHNGDARRYDYYPE